MDQLRIILGTSYHAVVLGTLVWSAKEFCKIISNIAIQVLSLIKCRFNQEAMVDEMLAQGRGKVGGLLIPLE
jgi:hypothetical protein